MLGWCHEIAISSRANVRRLKQATCLILVQYADGLFRLFVNTFWINPYR